MSVVSFPPSATRRFAVPPEPVLPLTVEQYHAMIRSGALKSGDPIELLEGWLVNKMIKNPPHSASTAKTRRRLNAGIPDGWSVDSQEPVTTLDSEAEPEVAVIRGLREEYVERHPGSKDVGLLVEVAEASLDRDHGWKKRIYAAAGIRVYWIVNLVERQVEVFTELSGPGDRPEYETRQVFLPGDQVPAVLDGKTRKASPQQLGPTRNRHKPLAQFFERFDVADRFDLALNRLVRLSEPHAPQPQDYPMQFPHPSFLPSLLQDRLIRH